MDDVEVDGVDAEAIEAPLDFRLRVAAPRVELRRDEDVLASKAAVAQGATHAGFVAVGLGSVDVAVAGLQRPTHRVLTLAPSGTCHTPSPSSGISLPSASTRARPSAVTVPAAITHSWTPGRDLPSRVASARAASPPRDVSLSHTDINLGIRVR
jgi:hypothetical protein